MPRGYETAGGQPLWWTTGAGATRFSLAGIALPAIEVSHGSSPPVLGAAYRHPRAAEVAERSIVARSHAAIAPSGTAVLESLARFIPGLETGIASVETATSVSINADPSAPAAKRAFACVNAGAAWVSASNVPIVSQVSAGLALAAGVGTAVRR
jgi:hypothetical protein